MNSLSAGQVYGQMRQKLNHLASVTCNGDVQVRCCFSSSAAHFSQPAPGLTEQLAIKHYKVCLRSTCNFLCSLESEILLSRMERHSRFDSFGNSVDVFFAATSEGWPATEVRLVVGCVVFSFRQVSLCCDFSLSVLLLI